jgi:hypothetical protein
VTWKNPFPNAGGSPAAGHFLFPLPLRERVRVRGKYKFAGGRPAAGYFFLSRQEKVTKKKATPVRRLPVRS